MHTLTYTAETCTKFFSTKRLFHQYIVSLLNIAAYCSMELFSFLKHQKFAIFNHAQTNARIS